MSLQTPLAKARGLGSAKQGTHHWWYQRVTAVMLVPLSIWFMIRLITLTGMGHSGVSAWLQSPVNAVLMIVLIISLFYHAQLGMQVVIEDYVDSDWQKVFAIILIKFLALFAGLTSTLAIVKVFLGI